ncbi:MAG: hypothetical protein R2753_17775 [Chitinophagales bacterium]
MIERIQSAIEWRQRYYKNVLRKKRWKLKNFLDRSGNEKVNEISIIVVGRNDNYGGDFSNRLRTSLEWNLKNIPNHELIYVEWNPVEGKDSDCLWIEKAHPKAKCYIVSREIHQQLSTNPNIPMMEYYAKNLGFRKASKDWILSINADICIGKDVAKNIKSANKNKVYATHYQNMNWNGEIITQAFLDDKNYQLQMFAADNNIAGVVGNLIFTHRDNWMKATGYDESLSSVRAGVDSDGLKQLFSLGLRPGVLGTHFHFDHGDSMINGKPNLTHGKMELLKNRKYPYQNKEHWGLENYKETKISDRIWQLEI